MSETNQNDPGLQSDAGLNLNLDDDSLFAELDGEMHAEDAAGEGRSGDAPDLDLDVSDAALDDLDLGDVPDDLGDLELDADTGPAATESPGGSGAREAAAPDAAGGGPDDLAAGEGAGDAGADVGEDLELGDLSGESLDLEGLEDLELGEGAGGESTDAGEALELGDLSEESLDLEGLDLEGTEESPAELAAAGEEAPSGTQAAGEEPELGEEALDLEAFDVEPEAGAPPEAEPAPGAEGAGESLEDLELGEGAGGESIDVGEALELGDLSEESLDLEGLDLEGTEESPAEPAAAGEEAPSGTQAAGEELELGEEALDLEAFDVEPEAGAPSEAEPAEAEPAGEAGEVDLAELQVGSLEAPEEPEEPVFDLGGLETGAGETPAGEATGADEQESFQAAPDVDLDEEPLDLGLDEVSGMMSETFEPAPEPEAAGTGEAAPAAPAAGEGEEEGETPFEAVPDIDLDEFSLEEPFAGEDVEADAFEAVPDVDLDQVGLLEEEAPPAAGAGEKAAGPEGFTAVPETEVSEEDLLELNLEDVEAARGETREETARAPEAGDSAARAGTSVETIPLTEQLEVPDEEFRGEARPSAGRQAGAPALSDELLMSISHHIAVELGEVSLNGRELMELSYGSVLPLNRVVGEPVDLVLEGKAVAQGEIVLINGKQLGVRIVALNHHK